ncbi:MAG TPA: MbcA/ParS/Xre antitoxin family protein [Methanothrix soehngenii]|nr:MbcA/ParS/Xre antitoxin family protein [Methanothrix soehngenii]
MTEIFKSRDKAREWMKEPHKALGGKPPAECVMTRSVAEEVLNLLGRIGHGVYS